MKEFMQGTMGRSPASRAYKSWGAAAQRGKAPLQDPQFYTQIWISFQLVDVPKSGSSIKLIAATQPAGTLPLL
tara:strand:- start:2315 stop:2533 length:219 start_codon:yes stop_codon:yes gene_type:complete